MRTLAEDEEYYESSTRDEKTDIIQIGLGKAMIGDLSKEHQHHSG